MMKKREIKMWAKDFMLAEVVWDTPKEPAGPEQIGPVVATEKSYYS